MQDNNVNVSGCPDQTKHNYYNTRTSHGISVNYCMAGACKKFNAYWCMIGLVQGYYSPILHTAGPITNSVFQITFKIRESMKNFEGSIALVFSKSS